MEKFFNFFFFVVFEASIAMDSEIFYSFNALLPSESLIKRSRFISRGVYFHDLSFIRKCQLFELPKQFQAAGRYGSTQCRAENFSCGRGQSFKRSKMNDRIFSRSSKPLIFQSVLPDLKIKSPNMNNLILI